MGDNVAVKNCKKSDKCELQCMLLYARGRVAQLPLLCPDSHRPPSTSSSKPRDRNGKQRAAALPGPKIPARSDMATRPTALRTCLVVADAFNEQSMPEAQAPNASRKRKSCATNIIHYKHDTLVVIKAVCR